MTINVFSIRPQHVARIIDGSKGYEYRTRRPSMSRGDQFLIYETAPRSMIVAVATIGEIIVDDPSRVWERTQERSGADRDSFDRYYGGRDRAVAIEIASVQAIDPVPLPASMAAPQAWAVYKGVWSTPAR